MWSFLLHWSNPGDPIWTWCLVRCDGRSTSIWSILQLPFSRNGMDNIDCWQVCHCPTSRWNYAGPLSVLLCLMNDQVRSENSVSGCDFLNISYYLYLCPILSTSGVIWRTIFIYHFLWKSEWQKLSDETEFIAKRSYSLRNWRIWDSEHPVTKTSIFIMSMGGRI
jgi:hypothetical protein